MFDTSTAKHLTHAERECVQEVIEQYDFTPAQQLKALAAIDDRAHNTSGRFYAYNTAHNICAAMGNAL